MAGTGGAREGAGRPKGSKNKVNPTAANIMAEYNVSGIEGLCRIASGEELECTVYGEKGAIQTLTVKPTFDQRQAAYKELAQYEAPKLKAVEHSGSVSLHEAMLDELD